MAYLSNDTGRNEIYVQAFPGAKDAPGGRWQVSRDGAQDVRWRSDGKELYFESLDGKIMAATCTTGPQGVVVETPRVLFSATYTVGPVHEFDVSADGKKFVVILDTRTEAMVNRLTVISNWQAAVGRELGKRSMVNGQLSVVIRIRLRRDTQETRWKCQHK